MTGYWFWLLLIWSPSTGSIDPYALHTQYPTEAQCESDGVELQRKISVRFKCELFYADKDAK